MRDSHTTTALPYFDLILGSRPGGADDALADHVHFGYWDDPRSADGFDEDHARAAERMCLELQRSLGVGSGQRILDVGCGFGGTLASIDRQFESMDLVGLNIDGRQLDVARARVRARGDNTLRFEQGDACALPFDNDSFDAVMAVECIFHFPSRTRFFAEARRVLRPGGRLLVSDFVPTEPMALFVRTFQLWQRWVPFDLSAASLYGKVDMSCTLNGYRRLAAQTGLRTVEERDVTLNTLPSYAFFRDYFRRLQPTPLKARMTDVVQRAAEAWARAGSIRYMICVFEAE